MASTDSPKRRSSRTLRQRFAFTVYNFFAKYLPSQGWSRWPARRLWGRFRGVLARQFLDYAGPKITIEQGATFGKGDGIRLGNRSGLGRNCIVQSPTTIGDDVMMGPDVLIFTNSHSFFSTEVSMIDQGYTQPVEVIIGNDVMINARAIIMPGTKIGKGVVIAAGAVVRGKIPDYSIVMGNPGKVIGRRSHAEENPGPNSIATNE